MPNLPPPICCEVSVGGRIVIVIFLFCLNSHLLKAMAVGSTCWSIISIQTQSYQTWFEEKNDMADQDKSTSSETCLFWNDRNDLLVKLRETFGTCPGFTNTAKAGPAHTCKKLLISHKGNWINTSVSARGASCHHVTPLLSSERPELEPRASKKINNSREDRVFIAWNEEKEKGQGHPSVGGAKESGGIIFAASKACSCDGKCTAEPWQEVLVEHARELRMPEPRSGKTEAPW